ncbi:MAG: NAD-dependent deacylase [Bernardetiaceae bacterium]|jgi:NAD-dependent deacetylase|nr:NAD-dependent deacylase [Bernardetiaceae bacterium]
MNAKPHLVVLSGAGVSAESGIPTFRDAGGLWEGHDIMEVASPQGWRKNPALVLDFYNQRRRAAKAVQPNAAHLIIKDLEAHFQVSVITQNVDNLHEKAGSAQVLHLHGSLFLMRGVADETTVFPIEGDIALGDRCPRGSQLRPHIVWFGEAVPMIEPAAALCAQADALVVVGTSLQVYPAAGLLDVVPAPVPKWVVDPHLAPVQGHRNLTMITDRASTGMATVQAQLVARFFGR